MRKFILTGFTIVAIAAASYWGYQRVNYVYSDDARIASDMIDISSKVSGWLVEFPVSSGDLLQKNDVLAVIDSRETVLKLQELASHISAMAADYEGRKAERSMVERQTMGALQAAESQLAMAEASLAASDSELEFRASEWTRAQALRERRIISQQDYEADKSLFKKSQQGRQAALGSVASARAKLIEAEAAQSRLIVMERHLARLKFEQESQVAELARHRIDLQDRTMVSPLKGIVDRIFIDPGEYVQPGRRLLMMHDPDNVWVDANIKETEIRRLRPGQSVAVSVDAYPDEVFTGIIEKIGHAATSQFSLLPSTNPSGNFTKVTQRLTVKIALQQRDGLLKPGMMVEVSIDIRDQDQDIAL